MSVGGRRGEGGGGEAANLKEYLVIVGGRGGEGEGGEGGGRGEGIPLT